MAEFERITGADFQQVPIDDWAHALESIRERDADVVFLAAETAARSEYMGFTTPHYTVESVLVTAQEMQLAMDEPGLQVITIRDYAIEDWLDESHPDVGYISADSFEEGLALLRDGEADAFAGVWRVVQAIAEREGHDRLQRRTHRVLVRLVRRVPRRPAHPGVHPAEGAGRHPRVHAGADSGRVGRGRAKGRSRHHPQHDRIVRLVQAARVKPDGPGSRGRCAGHVRKELRGAGG